MLEDDGETLLFRCLLPALLALLAAVAAPLVHRCARRPQAGLDRIRVGSSAEADQRQAFGDVPAPRAGGSVFQVLNRTEPAFRALSGLRDSPVQLTLQT